MKENKGANISKKEKTKFKVEQEMIKKEEDKTQPCLVPISDVHEFLRICQSIHGHLDF